MPTSNDNTGVAGEERNDMINYQKLAERSLYAAIAGLAKIALTGVADANSIGAIVALVVLAAALLAFGKK